MAKKPTGPLREPLLAHELVESSVPAFTESMRAGSDLACAILGGAAIENALMTLLQTFFIESPETERIFDIKGALDSVSSCNSVAYCAGLIAKRSYDNIKNIGIIRNRFAHSHASITFNDERVVFAAGKLSSSSFPDSMFHSPEHRRAAESIWPPLKFESDTDLAKKSKAWFSLVALGEFYTLLEAELELRASKAVNQATRQHDSKQSRPP